MASVDEEGVLHSNDGEYGDNDGHSILDNVGDKHGHDNDGSAGVVAVEVTDASVDQKPCLRKAIYRLKRELIFG